MSQEDRAWELYLNRGVFLPEYSSEIAERRKIMSRWEEAGEPLR